MDKDPPESPKHPDHTDTEESSVFANLGTYSPPIRPANAPFDPESASPRASPFTGSNSSWRRRLSLTGSSFGDHSSDFLRDHHCNSSVDSNSETGEMATGLPPLSLEQTKEDDQMIDFQRWSGLMKARDISQSAFFPEVDQNQHGSNRYGLQFEDTQHNRKTLEPGFQNIPENSIFQRTTPYNLQVLEPVSLHNSVTHGPINDQPTFGQRPPNPQIAGFENLCSSNPKSRQTLFNMTGNYSHKHCKCTKTECLNRYCDCFSDGAYCNDKCTCLECYNREEYEDTVQDAREKIENQNPNAFRSKIQQQDDDGTARHKTGCNCKKSKCLKKYCECYEANVGCSNKCQCVGCENTNGKKDEYLAKKHEMVAPQEALMHNDMSSIPHDLAPPSQFPNYAEPARNSWIEPAGPRPPTMATPYGMMSLPMQSSSTFPANNFYSVNDELMRSRPRFDMQMRYGYPAGDPMNPFSQNLNQFGNPYPVRNATNAGMFSHIGQNPTANARMFPHIGQNPTTNARNPTANARMFPHIGQNPTTNARNPTANARMFPHIGQNPTTNARMLPHNGQNPTANARMFPRIGQNPTANARMLFRNSQIPTNVNPFHRENVISRYGGGVSSIGNRRDAAHQMLEESPVPPYAFRGVTLAPAPAPARLNRITSSSSAAAAGDMSGYNYQLRNNAVQVVTPYASRVVIPAPAPTPLNPITSSSSSAAEAAAAAEAAEDLSGNPYLLRDVPSSKGFDGHSHTAKKD